MSATFRAGFCSFAISWLALAQEPTDWASLFQALESHDRAVSDPAREKALDQIVPAICKEDPTLAAAEIPGLVAQLGEKDDFVRLQASAVLAVIASFRPDSESVLSAAIPALSDHIRDQSKRVRENSVRALASLTPAIPDDALRVLVGALEGLDEFLAKAAAPGVARMAASSPLAAQAVDRALSDSNSARRLVMVHAMAAAHVSDSRLISRLGVLLGEKDQEVAQEALLAINDLGPSAVSLNLENIRLFSETTSNQDSATLAHQMLERASAAR